MYQFLAEDIRTIEGEELLTVLPHRGKMRLISRVVHYSVPGRMIHGEYDLTEDCLFYDPALGGVPGWVGFEFMAQAVSALAGISGKVLGKPAMIGFILSVASLEVHMPLVRPGDTVDMSVMECERIGPVGTFQASANVGKRGIATAKLMVMDVEDPSVFMTRDLNGA
jgi:predicted hotdog family 3-hydroxylacyl-ACP dehydratase